jgi:FSR family fosmidomycin resistance protein-like MFS transporter
MVAGVSGTLTQPLFGYLSDRWYARHITVLSLIWAGLMMGLIGFVNHYFVLLLLAASAGLGVAAFHPAGASVALTRSTGNRRGRSASVFSVSGNLGTALAPLWITTAIALVGLAGTITLIPLTLITGIFVYRQLKSAEKFEVAEQKQASTPHQKIRAGVMIGLLMIVMAVMTRTWFQITLVTYIPEWLQSQGYNLAYSGRLLAVLAVSVGAGSLTGGTLSDHIGRWQVILISLIALIPAYWLFMLVDGPARMALTAIIGMLVGASFPVAIVMAQDTLPDRVGLATSLVLGVGWVTGGIGAAVTGVLADKYSLSLGLQSLILAPVVGVLCVIVYVMLQRYQFDKTQKTVKTEKAPA